MLLDKDVAGMKSIQGPTDDAKQFARSKYGELGWNSTRTPNWPLLRRQVQSLRVRFSQFLRRRPVRHCRFGGFNQVSIVDDENDRKNRVQFMSPVGYIY